MKNNNRTLIKYFTLLIFILLFVGSCKSVSKIPINKIKMDFSSVSNFVKKSRSSITDLNKKRLGITGFYYIIDSDGVLVYHPQNVLIGRSFRSYWFIEIILAEKSGCIKYNLGEKENTIYFRPLNDSEILCFSIMSEEVKDNSSNCISHEKSSDTFPIE